MCRMVFLRLGKGEGLKGDDDARYKNKRQQTVLTVSPMMMRPAALTKSPVFLDFYSLHLSHGPDAFDCTGHVTTVDRIEFPVLQVSRQCLSLLLTSFVQRYIDLSLGSPFDIPVRNAVLDEI